MAGQVVNLLFHFDQQFADTRSKRGQPATSTVMPLDSISTNTSTSGISTVLNSSENPVSRKRASRIGRSRQVTSASSAA